jgi:hypothetical protein
MGTDAPLQDISLLLDFRTCVQEQIMYESQGLPVMHFHKLNIFL